MGNLVSKEGPQRDLDNERNEIAAGPPKWALHRGDDIIEVIEPCSPRDSLEEERGNNERRAKKTE